MLNSPSPCLGFWSLKHWQSFRSIRSTLLAAYHCNSNSRPPVMANHSLTTECSLHPEIIQRSSRCEVLRQLTYLPHTQCSAPPAHDSGASSTGCHSVVLHLDLGRDGWCYVTSVSLAEQGHSETLSHSGRRDHTVSPCWSFHLWFPHYICFNCVEQP